MLFRNGEYFVLLVLLLTGKLDMLIINTDRISCIFDKEEN